MDAVRVLEVMAEDAHDESASFALSGEMKNLTAGGVDGASMEGRELMDRLQANVRRETKANDVNSVVVMPR